MSMAGFLPASTQQHLLNFLDESDGNINARCNGLYEYLFAMRDEPAKTFGNTLLYHLFTPEYMETHHWPSIQ